MISLFISNNPMIEFIPLHTNIDWEELRWFPDKSNDEDFLKLLLNKPRGNKDRDTLVPLNSGAMLRIGSKDQ